MKHFFVLLLKSFLLSLLIFSLIATLIMFFAYSNNYKFTPAEKENSVLVVGVDNEKQKVISVLVINVVPNKKEISFLAIPDNTLLEDAEIFQDSYYEKGLLYLKKRTEELIGTSISRYVVLDSEKIRQIINSADEFPYSLNHPFEYNGQVLSGTVMLDGEKASAMLLYDGYDPKGVSISEISLSLFQAFLSETTGKVNTERISNVFLSDNYCDSKFTNMSEKELSEYILLLSEYNAMNHKISEIVGETNVTSARAYFIPKKLKADRNIFN